MEKNILYIVNSYYASVMFYLSMAKPLNLGEQFPPLKHLLGSWKRLQIPDVYRLMWGSNLE